MHSTNVPASQVILRVVPVQIIAATVMNTFALCDEASTTTLIDTSFAEQIGDDGPELPFCCRWRNPKRGHSRLLLLDLGQNGML
jgi:hypothetical protein